MSVDHTRRSALKLALNTACLLPVALAVPGLAAAKAAEKSGGSAVLRVEPLSERLGLVTGGASNVVVLRGAQGLLLVDGGQASDSAALARLLASAYPGLPIKVLFNTHWHLAQTGFNAEARRQGAEVIAHENTRQWMSTVINSRWENRSYPPQLESARPTKTFYDGVQSLDFEGQKVEYGLMPQAHTDGDIYVRFASENVVVAGDVLAPGRYPTVDFASNGWLGGMHTGLKTLAGFGNEQTRYVPGAGPVSGLAALKSQQELCYTVLSRIGESYFKGETWEQLLTTAPTREFDATNGDPALFLRQSYESAWYHVNEIRRIAR
jgi:glyoxylase-like metal-dependent hydrolase (beta-lactamase superfamily II)